MFATDSRKPLITNQVLKQRSQMTPTNSTGDFLV